MTMMAWWTDERIDATVDAEYVSRELQFEQYVAQLHRPLAFGDSLTDDTYLDWILEKGRRIFLILDHIGAPEFIFAIIDKTFDDDDLPISEEALFELNLFGGKSETLDKKFYRQQFQFLIQELRPGGHVDYGEDDIVPLEPAAKRETFSISSHTGDRVHVLNQLYARRKISTSGRKGIDREHFVMHMKGLQDLKHRHLVSVWATYTQNAFSYVLLTPTTDLNLKMFLDDQPKAFKSLSKPQRRQMLLGWTHCLTSALAYLHDKGFTHQAIRPSAISIDENYKVYLGDFGALKALDVEESPSSYNGELYDYAAPENWQRKPCLHETAPLRTMLPGGGRTSRRLPTEPIRRLPIEPVRRSPQSSVSAPAALPRRGSATGSLSSSSTHSRPQKTLITTFAPPPPDSPPSCPADTFSLTACLLQILSITVGRSTKSFASHRSRHNRHAGRGGAPADASFHVNLPQVCSWMDILGKEAHDRHRKDKKSARPGIWGAVIWIVEACRGGMKKEAHERIDSREMEREVRSWVDKALGPSRKQCCGEEEEEKEETDGWMDMGLDPRRKDNMAPGGVNSWEDHGRDSPTMTATSATHIADEEFRTTRAFSTVSTAMTEMTVRNHGRSDETLHKRYKILDHSGTKPLHQVDSESLREDMRRFGIGRRHDDWPLRDAPEIGPTVLMSPGESMMSRDSATYLMSPGESVLTQDSMMGPTEPIMTATI